MAMVKVNSALFNYYYYYMLKRPPQPKFDSDPTYVFIKACDSEYMANNWIAAFTDQVEILTVRLVCGPDADNTYTVVYRTKDVNFYKTH